MGVKKLKTKNGQLSDQISQMKVLASKIENRSEDEDYQPKHKKSKKDKKFEKRKIAIKFSYDGRDFNGLQRSPVPNSKVTVEDCLFNALIKSKIVDNVADSDYIAGGRTDK